MLRASYLVVSLVLAVLVVAAVGGTGFVIGHITSPTDESGTGSSASGDDPGSVMGSMMGGRGGDGMGSMMNGRGMMGRSMMGTFDEGKPFDLQFIDQMIPHHMGALMLSEHMISNSKPPEMRQLYE